MIQSPPPLALVLQHMSCICTPSLDTWSRRESPAFVFSEICKYLTTATATGLAAPSIPVSAQQLAQLREVFSSENIFQLLLLIYDDHDSHSYL